MLVAGAGPKGIDWLLTKLRAKRRLQFVVEAISLELTDPTLEAFPAHSPCQKRNSSLLVRRPIIREQPVQQRPLRGLAATRPHVERRSWRKRDEVNAVLLELGDVPRQQRDPIRLYRFFDLSSIHGAIRGMARRFGRPSSVTIADS